MLIDALQLTARQTSTFVILRVNLIITLYSGALNLKTIIAGLVIYVELCTFGLKYLVWEGYFILK